MGMILKHLYYFANNPLLTLITLFLAIVGIILACYFYRKSRKTKKPTFAIRSLNLVRNFKSKLKELELRYAGQEVEDLTISRVAFWNNGTDTMHSNDIANADPLRVVINPIYEMLDVEVICVNKNANQFRTAKSEKQKSEFKILFDYLDKHDGGVIQIIHTGKTSEDIKVLGTIKGAGKAIYRYIPDIAPAHRLFKKLRIQRLFGIATMIACLCFAIVGLIVIVMSPELKGFGFFFLFSGFFLGIAYYLLLVRRRIPSSLSVLEEEF